MRSAIITAFLLCSAFANAESCTSDPVEVFLDYQDAFFSMKTHDDESILKYLTASAAERFKQAAELRRKGLDENPEPEKNAMQWNKSLSRADREKHLLGMMRSLRGAKRPGALYPEMRKTDKTVDLIYRWQSDVFTSVKDGETIKYRTEHEFIAKMVCEGDWRLEQEAYVGNVFHEDYAPSGKLVGKGRSSVGFGGYSFP